MKTFVRSTLALALATAFLPAISVHAQDKAAPGQVATAAKAVKPGQKTADLLPFHATEKLLPNGLKIIIVPTGLPNIISLHIPVQTGSRNEIEEGKSGFAHFFEHMMFRGTKDIPADKYKDILTATGARQNAYTSDDLTNYHTTFSKEDLETMLRIEADRFQNLSYSEADFKTESRAVLGEYNKNSANPISKLFEVMRDAAYQKHTYKHTTMGFLKDIEDMPNQYAYSKVFFDRWYRPERTTVIIAGDVEPQKAIALVEKYWGKWQRGKVQPAVPAEPPATGAIYKHVPWPSPTLPYVTVAFHAPAFSEVNKEHAALRLLLNLSFGSTSALNKRLQQDEQKVDQLFDFTPDNVDPGLATIGARVKKPEDVVYVRDAILKTVAGITAKPLSDKELADAKSALKYGVIRSLDNTEQIASTLVRFVHYKRSYATMNQFYQLIDSLTPADLQAAAKKYLSDDSMIVTTLSNTALPAEVSQLPKLASFADKSTGAKFDMLVQKSALPQIRFKLVFNAGAANDPAGKEGLAALTAAMVDAAGSKERKIDEIKKALFPLAASFNGLTDKEMTTFSGSVHKDKWDDLINIALPQLLEPGFREEDFRRLKDAQKNALTLDLKDNNEEELAKERLQTNVFAASPYAHPVLGTIKGIDAITLDDVKQFWKQAYTKGALKVGISGDVTEAMQASLQQALAKLPEGAGIARIAAPVGKVSKGLEVEIIEKNTRATAISLGQPITVTRAHPDFAALWLAKTWLGEHRASSSHLYQRIREVRGMNYGDYAYIEAFPGGMFQFFPTANRARQSQLFEIWIRPVAPENAQMAIRVALTEFDRMVNKGLSKEEFEITRAYLMKNVFMMTATQDQQLGYAMDSQWHHTPEFTKMMRDNLSKLSLAGVNAAIKKHLSAENLSVVIIAKDAADLKAKLVADAESPIKYNSDKPRELLDEDQIIGKRKLNIKAEAVSITPASKVFAD
ncbi:M16 family metallopeptidase [Undibacterium pigrum]|uniref:Zinc protease n=1 Tax=Undibacterium pigrum TaxID=401470 RepID=A0A318J6Z8_9BURK|nr:pitrilysin family protein [Undibacterium pigrum]PXX43274.1 zinc protease [Undibacterium pigrum]